MGPRARTAFVAVFLAVEAALIATAGARADRSYGFRMFPESSSIHVHVSRRIAGGGVLVPLVGGRWEAKDCAGAGHTFVWSRMVRPPAPSRLDADLGAPYGVEASLAEARGALAYVAANTADDCETKAFVADVRMRRNGGEPFTVTVEASR